MSSHTTRLAAGCLALAGVLAPDTASAAFGLTTTTSTYVVDTGGGLVFTVNRSNGGITSIVWNGTELNDTAKASSINSGVGSTGTTVAATVSGTNIIVSVATDSTNGVVAGMTHYYVVKSGVNNIYMATYSDNEPSNGEFRWITRLQGSLFPTAPAESDLRGNTGAIESSDVFGMSDGTSRSKYYGNQRAKDLSIRGVTGTSRGVFMAYGNRESASGGPFFRDIQNQTGTDAEVYNYMNSGHNQTEAWRTGVMHGPYALCFTTGATPAVPDMSFLSSLGLTGYVPSTGRGRVILNGLAGRDTAYTYTVGYSNATAQYWVTAAASNGACGCYNMKPGTYTMTVYKNELAVYTESVTVTAGNPTTLNTRTISGDPSAVTPIWRIGDWDGTPLEFLNGGNLNAMHPSDVRQSSWAAVTHVIGTNVASDYPAYQWKDINGTNTITFNLTAAQVAAHTVRVGLTAAYEGGRPKLTVNSWSSSNPSASSQPDSRSLTIGTYRGNNVTYTFSVPASAFVTGTNTIKINPISGSGATGYLSAGYSIDCIDFY
ncbi:rhamnogalacturonan lyase B N-terminal domain-containing protein [Luteolibacter sp. LG18]|uniref:rhamnogalacturonan lyase B N-terminal domain-containing protein n=1 Tax=Luteolibacter sp. LG18 TaxID=2819286 RepID=UPI002B2CDFD0|nr:hypothetical protein llg_26270 [Luteolibacter sp. LG18]